MNCPYCGAIPTPSPVVPWVYMCHTERNRDGTFRRSKACLRAENDQLQAENERLKGTFDEICHYYCNWFDNGIPNQDGSSTAYDLVMLARKALEEGEG